MARDLYGELLARALQRRAPPGHFPAFVTPGEANLLRSQGGGVAPGGGQFMAGGIPAFFEYGGDYGGLGTPGYGGSAMGFEDFGTLGVNTAPGGMLGEFGGLGFDAGNLGFGVSEGEHGRSVEEITRDYVLEQIERSRQKAEEEAAAAKAAAAMEQQFQAKAAAQAQEAAAQSRISQALARTPPAITVETVKPAVPPPMTTVHTDLTGEIALGLAPGFFTLAGLEEPSAQNFGWGTLGTPTGPHGQSTYGGTTTSPGVTEGDIATGMFNVTSPAVPGFTGTISEPGTESFFEESLEQDQTPYSGDTTDAGTQAQATAQSILDAQAQAAALSIESGFGNLDAQAAAVAATGQDPTAGNVDNQGNITAQGAANIAADIGTNSLAQGRFSPAASWGALSEVAQENIAAGRKSGLTAGMIAALNAQDQQGYAINNPQPSEASILASQVFAQLNPTITNAVIGLAGFLPGTVGFAATIAGLAENKGLLNIPGVRSIPGVSALSDALAGVRTGIGDFFSPITDPIGQALSEGQQAVADALSGIIGTEESAGFDDAGEVDGGAPDIEIVPPIATDTDATPAPTARTFADVDDETRRRILANIISGLQRTGRPTEGVTAFGPLFT